MKIKRNFPGMIGRGATAASAVLCAALVLSACTPASTPTSTPTDAAPVVDEELRGLLPDSIVTSGVVRIAGDFATPPTLSANVDDPSKPVGIAPDLMVKVGEILGVDFQWQSIPFSGQLPGLETGNFDALMGQISVNPEREQSVVDLVPWLKSQEGVLLRADHEVKELADLCGLNIGVPTGSLGIETVNKINKKFCEDNPFVVSDWADNAAGSTGVLSGQIDGFFVSLVIAAGFAEKSPSDFGTFAIPREESAQANPGISGIAINKATPGLSKAIAGALLKLAADGTYDEIFAGAGWEELALTTDEMGINVLTGTPVGTIVAG